MNNIFLSRIPYAHDYRDKIELLVDKNFNLIGIDPGKKNLLMMTDIERNKLRYTNVQHRIETGNKAMGYELNKLVNLPLKTTEHKQRIKCLRNNIKHKTKKSFNNLLNSIGEIFGENIIIFLGDSGLNDINIEVLEYLFENISGTCYVFLVDESNTSKICCKCGGNIQLTKRDDTIVRGLIFCPHCSTMHNRDTNSCFNIILKGIKLTKHHDYLNKKISSYGSFKNRTNDKLKKIITLH